MKKRFLAIALLLMFTTGCLAGCAKHFEPADIEIKPVQGTLTPHYSPAQATFELQEYNVIKDKEIPQKTTGLIIHSAASGELLRWGMALMPDSKGTGALFYLVITDTLGAIQSANLVPNLNDPQMQKIVSLIGESFFKDLITPLVPKALTNGEVLAANAPIIASLTKEINKLTVSAILAGETTYKDTSCYVISYSATSDKYTTKEKDLVHAEFSSFMLLDKTTMLPVAGKQTAFVIYEDKQKSPIGRIRRIRMVR